LIFGILTLSYLIPYIFIKTRKNKGIKKILKESEKFKNVDNYIQIKRYEFEESEKITVFLLGISITLLLAIKITNFGWGGISYFILGIGFIALFSILINLNTYYNHLMKELYKKKDLLEKNR